MMCKNHFLFWTCFLYAFLSIAQINSPDGSIKGWLVSDDTNEPVSSGNIIVQGTNKGTISDENGYFKIDGLEDGTYALTITYLGFNSGYIDDLVILDGDQLDIGTVRLTESPIKLSEVVITPGSFTVMGVNALSMQTLNEKDLRNITWAEDLTRSVTRLPGVASNDFSSRFSVRGGEADEVLMVLDGMELYEPFHQRDFVGGLFSIVDIETIGSVELLTGGFGSEYGQRQSAVFNMKSKDVKDNQSKTSIGLSVLNARVYTDGNFSKNRGKYLLSVRRGILDLALKAVGADEVIPTYYDALAKVSYQLNENNLLTFHNLFSGDKTAVNDIKPDNFDKNRTQYLNNYTWFLLTSKLSENLNVNTMVYGGYVHHNRSGLFHKRDYVDKGDFSLQDKRTYFFGGLKQAWTWDISKRLALKTGFDFRQLSADYQYSNSLREIRVNTQESLYVYDRNINILTKPTGQLLNGYLSGRASLTKKMIAEVGVRYDKATYANDNLFSPRAAITYAFDKETYLRAAYGHYYQSQFINALEVNYGVTKFNPAELSKHYVLGFEHVFKNKINFRVEAYYKDISNISPQYRNLRDALEQFPEARNDVVVLDIDGAKAKGIEFFMKYDEGKKFSWWFSYALADARDNIRNIEFDGLLHKQLGEVRRPLNQKHTINADLNYRFNEKWSVNLSWQYYVGWPVTNYTYEFQRLPADNELGQETAAIISDGDIQFYARHGKFNGDSYPAYHRADFRVNRKWQLRNSNLTAFVHIINLYNHFNLRKLDRGIEGEDTGIMPNGNGEYTITNDDQSWFGITPVFGISWELFNLKKQ
jgi:outer membrane receptor for ferrienterochelin and colicin